MTKTISINRRKMLLGLSATGLILPRKAFANASLNAVDLGLKTNSTSDQSEILQGLINSAKDIGLPLFIASGTYHVSGLHLPSNISIFGISGATILKSIDTKTLFTAKDNSNITIKDIDINGSNAGSDELIYFYNCQNITLDNLGIKNSSGNGVYLEKCQGSISNCSIKNAKKAAIHLQDSIAMIANNNHIKDCGNGGILVWRYQNARDGSIITNNQISGIGSDSGNGQNGNGINTFLADEIIIANNSITDCAFSAVRANTTNNTIIKGNTCTQCQEAAIFSEFGFSGSIISQNIIDQAAFGIAITNFDDNGRLAICSNNIVRNIWNYSPTNPDTKPGGILAEADTAVIGNIIESAQGVGIIAGWGPYLRNVLISNNIVRDTKIGIGASAVKGAGIAHISNNIISNSSHAAISGMEWEKPVGDDLSLKPEQFKNIKVKSNSTS